MSYPFSIALPECVIVFLADVKIRNNVEAEGWVSGIYLLTRIQVIDGWGRRWRPPPRWSSWALSHCAMIAAAIPDPHHHIIDTKPTTNLPLASVLWHRLRRSCLDYHPARMSNNGEEHRVHKQEDKFVCLSLPSSPLIFPIFECGALWCKGQPSGARVKWPTQGE